MASFQNACKLINWADCVRIPDKWITDYLISHSGKQAKKLEIRAYSIAFSGTQQQIAGLVGYVSRSIKKFVFSDSKIKELEEQELEPYQEAMKYFGDTDPEKDGKYGELILFLLTESVLKIPMIAHKLPLLTNRKSQVQGGDNIFFGDYKGQNALLIGESKVMQSMTSAINDALESLDRFHGKPDSEGTLEHELIIAKKSVREDLTKEQLDFLYDSLTLNTQAYHSNVLVHPVLIIYDEANIQLIEDESLNKVEAEIRMNSFMTQKVEEIHKKIWTYLSRYPEVATVYLDFFFIPVKSVGKLRHALYQAIHGTPYRNNAAKKRGGSP